MVLRRKMRAETARMRATSMIGLTMEASRKRRMMTLGWDWSTDRLYFLNFKCGVAKDAISQKEDGAVGGGGLVR